MCICSYFLSKGQRLKLIMKQAVKATLWRLWKWLLHLFTGNCEVTRLCLSDITIDVKTKRVGEWLYHTSKL